MVANGGRAKASLHHDSQSNKGVGSGKGSETVCFLGVRSKPRGFLTAGSSEFDSDKRLFRDSGGEGEVTTWEGVCGRESRWEVRLGDGTLNSTSHYSLSPKMRNGTHKRRLRGWNKTGWGSDENSGQDLFRFRECWEMPSSLSSESVECVSEGVADWLRDGGDGCGAISGVHGDGGV